MKTAILSAALAILACPPWAVPADVKLSWTQNQAADGVLKYTLKWGLASGGPYTGSLAIAAWASAATARGLTPGLWYFVVTATSATEESQPSNEVSKLVLPTAPTSFKGAIAGGLVRISWSPSPAVEAVTGYSLSWGTARGGPYPNVVPTAVPRADLTLGAGSYYLVATSHTASLTSAASREAGFRVVGPAGAAVSLRRFQ